MTKAVKPPKQPKAPAKQPAPKSPPKPRMLKRYISRREAVSAAERLRTTLDGERYVVRFSVSQQVEHVLLMLSFTMLAVTGLAQTFYNTLPGSLLLAVFGGIEQTRQIHHLAAFVFILQSIYHVGVFIYQLFVYRHISRMFPDLSDIEHVIQMLKLNLGLSHKHPRFDRYSFEEKAEYWALVWGTVAMAATGLMQWFPVLLTDYLPGWAIPVARSLHKWEAILAVLAILTWHFYHTVLKTINVSIFTGIMTIEQMEEEHPIELAYLEQAASFVNSKTWPMLVQIPLDVEPGPETEKETREEPVEAPAPVTPTATVTPESEGSA